jgi:hypothetical protein
MSAPALNNLTVSINQNDNTVQIGDNLYTYYIYLLNPDNKMIAFKYSGIQELSISDDLKYFYSYGHMIFSNTLDAIESASSLTDVPDANDLNPYVFRGDGRDYLLISKEPVIISGDAFTRQTPAAIKQKYNLLYLFCVYDYEDFISQDKDLKLKKLYFHDYSLQIFKERNSFFVTGRGISNTEREDYTGNSIKSLIVDTFKDYKLTPTFDSNWDLGSSRIFYSSPANYKAIDDLSYLLDYHVSALENDYAPCILKKDRSDIWYLKPINTYFKEAYYKGNQSIGDVSGPRMLENFSIGKSDTSLGTSSVQTRVPTNNPFVDTLADYSLIESFQLSNMSPTDVYDNMVTNIVHHYNYDTKTFGIDGAANSIQSSLDVYNKHFVRTMKGFRGKSPSSNLIMNQTRLTNKSVNHVYNISDNEYQRLNSGRNKFLLSGLFLNTALSFRARGNTARQPGMFITVNRADSQSDNSFDTKLLGIYFVIKVEHFFYKGSYYNNMICIKTYNSNDLNLSDKIL